MSATNVTQARRWFDEVWNQRRPEAVAEILEPQCVGHTEAGDMVGGELFLERIYRPFVQAFPDLQITVEDVLSDGDKVVVRWRARGTHQGDGLGIPPTQRPMDARGMTWMEFRDGRMVEAWDCWNIGGTIAALTAV
jgi:steroid delta-isomerase-like uncharacterized protein